MSRDVYNLVLWTIKVIGFGFLLLYNKDYLSGSDYKHIIRNHPKLGQQDYEI